jgi:hypothetical protein
MQVSLSTPTFVPTILTPRKTKGGLSALWSKLSTARVDIGKPLYQRIDAEFEGVGTDTAAFIKSQKQSSFYFLRLACTFWDDPGSPFISARFQTLLRAADGGEDPIAWSMLPDQEHDEVVEEDSVELTPSLKVTGVGLSGKAAKKMTQTRKLPRVQAFGEQQSNVAWKINRTELTPITGSMRFSIVVRALKNAKFSARVTVDAEIEQKGILFYCEAKAPSADALSVTIP